MCSVDLEPCEVWSETPRQARKAHRCSCCGQTIARGETYVAHFSVLQGDVTAEKLCGRCGAFRDEFSAAHGDELIPTPSYFPQMLADYIADGERARWEPMLTTIAGGPCGEH